MISLRHSFRLQFARSLYKKPSSPTTYFVKRDIDKHIHELLFEYSNVPDEKVSLYSNLQTDLLLGERERIALQFDVVERFSINLASHRTLVRDLKSGREYADWVAAQLEELGRFVDYPAKAPAY